MQGDLEPRLQTRLATKIANLHKSCSLCQQRFRVCKLVSGGLQRKLVCSSRQGELTASCSQSPLMRCKSLPSATCTISSSHPDLLLVACCSVFLSQWALESSGIMTEQLIEKWMFRIFLSSSPLFGQYCIRVQPTLPRRGWCPPHSDRDSTASASWEGK